MKSLIVTGDREWDDLSLVRWVLTHCMAEGYGRLINGKARGLDRIARSAALQMEWEVEDYPYIGELGRAGGVVRNQLMLDSEADADLVLAFHDDLEESKGTRDMVRRSRKVCREVRHFTTSGECKDENCICRRPL
jgi:hypothetical protein